MAVGAKDVIASLPQNGALPDLCPCLQLAEMAPLPEVAHQVEEAKFCQNVRDELAARVLGLIQVHVDISHQDWVLNLDFL